MHEGDNKGTSRTPQHLPCVLRHSEQMIRATWSGRPRRPTYGDPIAQWPAGRQDIALQSCTRVTGAAGTYSAGPLATAYPPTAYTAGYIGVGAPVAPGDAQFADQRQAAQDSQTGTSYMAPTRPSTSRTGGPTAHCPPRTAQAQTAQVQTDRQRTGKAAGREDMRAL